MVRKRNEKFFFIKRALLSALIIGIFFTVSIIPAITGSHNLDNDCEEHLISWDSPQLSDNHTMMSLFYETSGGERGDHPVISLWYPENIRWREVVINQEIYDITQQNVNGLIQLNVFDDKQVIARIGSVSTNVLGTKTISGSIMCDIHGTFVVSITEGECLIIIQIPGRNELFITQYDAKHHIHYLVELRLSAFRTLPSAAPLIPPVEEVLVNDGGIDTIGNGDDCRSVATIDVMIVYTPAAKNWANSQGGGINNVISTVLATSQLVLANSDTLTTMNLVHAAEVPYVECGDMSVDLRRLTASPEFNPWGTYWNGYHIPGYMDEVHEWRDQYGADLIQLFTGTDGNYAGVAWLLNDKTGRPQYGFSLTRVDYALTYTPIHEFGHNMGCHHHKQQNVQPGPTQWNNWPQNTWSAGWRWTGTSRYCTVMTYQSGQYFPDGNNHVRVPFFSNPDVSYEGFPTGDAVDGDNARTIREMRHILSAYRDPIPEIYFRNLESFPHTIARIDTGAAVMKMMLDFLMWNNTIYDEPQSVYSEQDLYDAYAGDDHINASEMCLGLRLEIDDRNATPPWSYGYFFNTRYDDDALEVLRSICIWLDYDISGHNDLRSVDVPKMGHPFHAPVAVPTGGSYQNWMVIRGIHTNRSLWDISNPGYHQLIAGPVSMYGFWLNDPCSEGLGDNTYVTAPYFTEMYFEQIDVAGDVFYGKYVAVVDPPEHIPVDTACLAVNMDQPVSGFSSAEKRLLSLAQRNPKLAQHIVNELYIQKALLFVRSVLAYDSSRSMVCSDLSASGAIQYQGHSIVVSLENEDIKVAVYLSSEGQPQQFILR